jgi:2-polyprenyl-3-methyl-5-hydroxy-6-metoxy-1,4-benzoquinol methylase
MASKRERWNERYSATELVWGEEPNRFLVEELGDVVASGRTLDLACGEGRNAIWLAARGFAVTAVDFSAVAIERARSRAAERGVHVDWVCDDVTRFEPPVAAFQWVVILYLQIPGVERSRALAHAASALAPGGRLLMVGHAVRNLVEGVGGPQQPDVLWDPEEIARELGALGLEVERAEHVLRPVEEQGTAVDALLRARRSSA